jgi:DeoR/GlpR family transcriptional regulator of sugar metabolism
MQFFNISQYITDILSKFGTPNFDIFEPANQLCMLKEERFDYILKALSEKDKISYEMMASKLNVSEDTIRRDIDILEKNGLLSKVRGGAILRGKNPLTFQDRASYFSGGKEVIALKAQQLIKDGQTIYMDGGTTVCAIASQLPINIHLRIISNNTALIPILANYKDIEHIILGGTHNKVTQTTTGGQTCNEINKYTADLYFMGVCAIHSKLGVTAVYQPDGEVKQAMHKSALRSIALANSEKLDTSEYFRVCELKDVSGMITDLPSNDSKLDSFRNSGISLL